MKSKVLVLGGSGMLGHVLLNKLEKSSDFLVNNLVFKNKANEKSIVCDVTNITDLENILFKLKPDFIINCIGLLKDASNNDFSKAIYLNSFLPQWLLSYCNSNEIRLIHVSTDCVFNGNDGNYHEESKPNANDNYGKSKLLGEFNSHNHLCIRTSIIGPELKNNGVGLFCWFLKQKGEVNGFSKSIWGGVTTLVLSEAIITSIKKDYTGLVHLTNGKPISKFDLLSLIKDNFDLNNINLSKVPGKNINRSLITNFNYFSVPDYDQMIKDLKKYYLENY